MSIGVNLFSLTGARLTAPTITLEGNTFRGFDLNEWAVAGGPDFREGSLQVAYTGGDMELGGVVKLVDTDRSLIFDEELAEPMMFASSRLEGVWWLPSHNAELRLVLSNTADAPLSVNLNVNGILPKPKEPSVLSLSAHETRVMKVQDLAGNGRGTLSKIGGISINHSGSPGSLLVRGLVQEPEIGYSSVIEFSDPQTAKSSRLDGAGLRIGKISGEQLTQAAVARNVGDSSSVITGRIAYAMSDGSTSEVSLPQVHLAPGEVREVKLAQAIKASGLRSVAAAGLQFEYSGQPGSVIMSAQSVSSSGNQVFRVPLVDAKAQSSSTGKYPWSIDDTASTFVYLKNTTDHPQKCQLQLNYQGGAYAQKQETEDGLRVIVPINEGALYRLGEVKIEGSTLFSPAQILEMLTLKTGDIVDADSLSVWFFERVKKAYGDFGYIQYTAEPQPKFHLKEGGREGIVDLTVTIDEGHTFTIRSIKFEGNGNVPESILRREMLLRNGDVFGRERFNDSLKIINQMGVFEQIDSDKDVDYRVDNESARLDITIHLKKRT